MFKIINFRRAEQSGSILGNFDVQVGESFILKNLKIVASKKSGERFISPQQEEFEWKGKTAYRSVGFGWVYDNKERTAKSQKMHDEILALAEEVLETAPEVQKKQEPREQRPYLRNDERQASRDERQAPRNDDNNQKNGGFSF